MPSSARADRSAACAQHRVPSRASPGNIPWSCTSARRSAGRAIPYCRRQLSNFSIVGTTPDIFTKFQYRAGRSFTAKAEDGSSTPTRRKASSAVSSRRKPDKGRRSVQPVSRLVGGSKQRHKDQYTVVGPQADQQPIGSRRVDSDEGIYGMSGRPSGHGQCSADRRQGDS